MRAWKKGIVNRAAGGNSLFRQQIEPDRRSGLQKPRPQTLRRIPCLCGQMGWTPVTELARAMGDKKKVREVFAKSYAAFREEELDEGPVH